MKKAGMVLMVCALAVTGMLDGCKKKDSQKLTVGMMPKVKGIVFFNACEKGAKEAAQELGIDLTFDGPITADVAKQAEKLDTWITLTQNTGVIAADPNDPHALAPTLKKAMQKGIKVLTWDADSDPDSRDYFVSQATDEDVANAMVDTLADQIGGKGEVAIVSGTTTAANQNVWMKYMDKRIADKYPEMKVVQVEYPGEDQQAAFQKTKDLVKAWPNLKGIFAITSVALPGAAQALEEAGLSGKLALTGLATPNNMKPYVAKGTVKAFVLWNTVDLGYLTVYAASELHEKGTLPAEFKAGRLGTIKVTNGVVLLGKPIVFTKDNIDKYDF
jgi:rhamnose ABC transporter rhamnose-binding protein